MGVLLQYWVLCCMQREKLRCLKYAHVPGDYWCSDSDGRWFSSLASDCSSGTTLGWERWDRHTRDRSKSWRDVGTPGRAPRQNLLGEALRHGEALRPWQNFLIYYGSWRNLRGKDTKLIQHHPIFPYSNVLRLTSGWVFKYTSLFSQKSKNFLSCC